MRCSVSSRSIGWSSPPSVMLNAYRDFRIAEKVSIYGSAGLGLA
jgi:opacity protein-like surface antigen